MPHIYYNQPFSAAERRLFFLNFAAILEWL